MIRNHFKMAVRHFLKNKTYSLINFSGLVIGLACSFCIASYIYHESTFDTLHPEGDQTYRLVRSEAVIATSDKAWSAYTFLPIIHFIKGKIPEIAEVVRVKAPEMSVLTVGTEAFIEKDMMWADTSLFSLFHTRFLEGSFKAGPGSLVLTQSKAQKFFGSDDAVGQRVTVEGQELIVTGVIEDLPSNTHLRPGLIGSFETLKNPDDPWSQQGYMYVKLNKGADPARVTEKVNNAMKGNVWWLSELPVFQLQAVADIHLQSQDIWHSPESTDIRYLYIFGFIGVILVFSTAFNYISLAMADISDRKKDLGIQRILGSSTRNLITQFITECFLVCILATLAAIALTVQLLPLVNNVLDTRLSREFFLSLPNVLILFSVTGLLVLLSALYPAILTSRVAPLRMVRDTYDGKGFRLAGRRSLMTVQFFIAIVLVVSLMVVQNQMNYLSSERLGFEKDQVVVLKTPRFSKVNAPLIKQELSQVPGVSSSTVATGTPLGGGISFDMESDSITYTRSDFFVDRDYVPTLGMEIISGSNFTPSDSGAAIVNEAMVRARGWAQPLGRKIDVLGKTKEIKGVVRDFQMNNIHTAIHPVVLIMGSRYTSNILVRLNTGQVAETLKNIEKVWKEVAPGHPLEYSFLDEHFSKLYHAEIKFQRLSGIFSAIAILIACLGLYGAVLYETRHRVKEIGIRKVLGASVPEVAALLSKEYLQIVLIALALAAPVSWWAMNRWLRDFAYRVEIGWGIFVLAGLAVLAIALLTISYQAIRAAAANPVKSLRTE